MHLLITQLCQAAELVEALWQAAHGRVAPDTETRQARERRHICRDHALVLDAGDLRDNIAL